MSNAFHVITTMVLAKIACAQFSGGNIRGGMFGSMGSGMGSMGSGIGSMGSGMGSMGSGMDSMGGGGTGISMGSTSSSSSINGDDIGSFTGNIGGSLSLGGGGGGMISLNGGKTSGGISMSTPPPVNNDLKKDTSGGTTGTFNSNPENPSTAGNTQPLNTQNDSPENIRQPPPDDDDKKKKDKSSEGTTGTNTSDPPPPDVDDKKKDKSSEDTTGTNTSKPKNPPITDNTQPLGAKNDESGNNPQPEIGSSGNPTTTTTTTTTTTNNDDNNNNNNNDNNNNNKEEEQQPKTNLITTVGEEQPKSNGSFGAGFGGSTTFTNFGNIGSGNDEFPDMDTDIRFPILTTKNKDKKDSSESAINSGTTQGGGGGGEGEVPTAPSTYGMIRTTEPFRTAGRVTDFNVCFDKQGWCDEIYDFASEYYSTYPFANDSPFYGQVFANFVRDVYCAAASRAMAYYDFYFVASGEFSLGREGNADKLSEIKLDTHTKHASVLLTQSMAEAEAQSGAKSDAYAFSSIDCGTLALFPSIWRLCEMAHGSQEAVAMAAAKSNSTSFSEALSSSSQGANVYAAGQHIDKFVAVMGTSASNFAAAKSRDFAEAWSSALSIALNQACLAVCQRDYEDSASFPSCAEACLIAQSVASQMSASFAEAMGLAVANLEVSMLFYACYQDRPGTTNDHIAFGVDGYVNGQIEASCKTQTAFGSLGGALGAVYGPFGN